MKKFFLLLTLATLNLALALDSFGSESRMETNHVDDEKCDVQLGLFSDALAKRDLWALKMFDSWGKIESGYLVGNHYSFGHFDECVNFRFETDSSLDSADIIQGQYCLVSFTALPNSTVPSEETMIDGFDWREIASLVRNQSASITNGICLPAFCSEEKALGFANSFLADADLHATRARCSTNDPKTFEVIDIVAITIYSTFALLLLSSTTCDILTRRYEIEANKLLIAFSVYTNGEKLFDVTRNQSPKSINSLNGLRALSVFWIMFGHRVLSQANFPMRNPHATGELYNKSYSVVLSSYNLAVDTFFVMGGLLATVSILNVERKKLSHFRIALHRYLRYTPVFAALILYVVSISKFTFNGPGRPDGIRKACTDYWWSALLHVQNMVNPLSQCSGHGWYLSADFQLFMQTPLLLLPARKFGWKYLLILPALAVLSSIYILILSIVKDIRVLAISTSTQEISAQWIYFATHARMGSWMVGMVVGFVLFSYRDKKIEISKTLNAILWILSLATLATVVMLAQPLNQLNNSTSLAFNAIYLAFHRLFFALSVCWIIFACEKLKTGGFIRWFLSLPQWQPIARMSLSMYLVHPYYQLTGILNQKDSFLFEILPMFHLYWGDIFVTLVLGSALYLTFEAPIMLIESYFLSRRGNK